MFGAFQWSMRAKIIGVVLLTSVICACIALLTSIHFSNKDNLKGLVNKSRTIHSRLDVASRYVANQGGLKSIVDQFTTKYKTHEDMTDEDKKLVLQQVPVFAAMKIGSENSEKEYYSFRVFSDEPRRLENKATLEEQKIFNQFLLDPELEEIVSSTPQKVVVYRPVRLAESNGCLTCHGDPASSPWGNGMDILGYPMENWKDGKLHGVFAISNDVAIVQKALAAETGSFTSTTMLVFFIVLGGMLACLIAFLMLNKVVHVLQTITHCLAESGGHLTSASEKVATSSQSLSTTSTEQASSLEETVASMEELSAMVDLNAQSAKKTAELAHGMRARAQLGESEMKKLLQSLDEVATDAKRIQQFTDVIDDLAFQINLLSLNAAVEASRAGEHGKGFAVVAEAVRSLAVRSASSAKDIAVVLKENNRKIQKSYDDAEKLERNIGQFAEAAESVSVLAEEIASASQEQSQGLQQMSHVLNELDQVTQKNAAASVSTASAAEELAQQSESLKSSAASLKLIVFGNEKVS